MPLALAGMLGPEQDYIKGSTPTDNAIIEGKKTTLALGDLATKQKAQDYVNGNLKDLYSQAKRNDLSAEGAAALMQYNPDLYNHMATLQKDASEQALKRDAQLKNFVAGGIAHVNASPDKVQGWNDFRMAAKANGVPLGAFDAEYSPQLYDAAKMSVVGLDALKTGPVEQRDGIIVQRTPLGEEYKGQAVKAEKPAEIPAIDPKTNKEITRTIDLGNGKTRTERQLVSGKWENLGESSQPQKPGKLVPTVDENGNQQWELVGQNQLPVGKPAPNAAQNKAQLDKAQAYKAVDILDATLAEYKKELKAASRMDLLNPMSEKNTRIASLATQMQMAYKNAAELGAIAGPDWAIINRIIQTPTTILGTIKGPDVLMNQLDQVSKLSARDRAFLDKKYGQQGGQQVGPQGANMQHYQAALKAAAGNPAKIKAINDRARQMGIIK